ncbi:MAG: ferredoxin [Candidatus Aenigmatarchaeota archaeon]
MPKVTVDKKLCIGCSLCVSMLPEVFELDKDGKSIVKNENGAPIEKIKEVANMCPTKAIKVKK